MQHNTFSFISTSSTLVAAVLRSCCWCCDEYGPLAIKQIRHWSLCVGFNNKPGWASITVSCATCCKCESFPLSCSSLTKSTVKRKLYEDGALPASSDSPKKVIKKSTAAVSRATQGTPAVISVSTAQVVMASGLQGPPSSQPPVKKQKTAGEARSTL